MVAARCRRITESRAATTGSGGFTGVVTLLISGWVRRKLLMVPQRLTPSFREKIWGATRLEPWFPNSERKIGEVWFEDVDDLPLLIKFIFTSENLSVQVHPGDDYARKHHDSYGKTEMWHILAAEAGARVAAGFRAPLSADRLKAAALSGEIEDLLEWFVAKPGDTFFIPAGTVHAIGGGLVLCEIQQRSDITYRLYDYGRPRELHLEQGLEVSALAPYAALQHPRSDVLAASQYFTTSKLSIDSPVRLSPKPGDFEMLIVIQGAGWIADRPAKAGEAWHVAAGTAPFEIAGKMALLRVVR
jgi:mannose-6-phosphate isomerase